MKSTLLNIVFWIIIPESMVIAEQNGKPNLPLESLTNPLSPSEPQVSVQQVLSRTLSILLAMNEAPFLLLKEKLKEDSIIQAFLQERHENLEGRKMLFRKKRMAIPQNAEVQSLKEVSITDTLFREFRTDLSERRNEISQLTANYSNLSKSVENSTNYLQKELETLKSANATLSQNSLIQQAEMKKLQNQMEQLSDRFSQLKKSVANSTNSLGDELQRLKSADQSPFLMQNASNQEIVLNTLKSQMGQLNNSLFLLTKSAVNSSFLREEFQRLKSADKTPFLLVNVSNQQKELNLFQTQLTQLNISLSLITVSVANSTSYLRNELQRLKSADQSPFLMQNISNHQKELKMLQTQMGQLNNSLSLTTASVTESTSSLRNELQRLKSADKTLFLIANVSNQQKELNMLQTQTEQLNNSLFQLTKSADNSKSYFQKELQNSTGSLRNETEHVKRNYRSMFGFQLSQLTEIKNYELNNWQVGQFVADVLHSHIRYQFRIYAKTWRKWNLDHFGISHSPMFTDPNKTLANWIECSFGQRISLDIRNLNLQQGDFLRIYDPYNTSSFLLQQLTGNVSDFFITSISNVLMMDMVHSGSLGRRNYEFRFESKDISTPVIYPVTKSLFHGFVFQLMEQECHLLKYKSCTVIEKEEGSIVPPLVDGRYRNGESQMWLLKPGSGKRIALNTTKMKLAKLYDRVFVYDSFDLPKFEVAKWNGSQANQQLVSAGPVLSLDFQSDASNNDEGFEISFKTVNGSTENSSKEPLTKEILSEILAMLLERNCVFDRFYECLYFTSSEGNLSSPHYPSNYPKSFGSITLIKVEKSKRISFIFDDFYTEECCDTVRIYDPYSHKFQVAQLSGDQLPKPIRSVSNVLILEFDTDKSINKKGFFARYYTID